MIHCRDMVIQALDLKSQRLKIGNQELQVHKSLPENCRLIQMQSIVSRWVLRSGICYQGESEWVS